MNRNLQTAIPGVIIVIALVGFMVTSYWHQKQELDAIKAEFQKTQEEMTGQIVAQAEKIMQREQSIAALSRDLVKKEDEIKQLKTEVSADREDSTQEVSSLQERVIALKMLLDEATRTSKQLETRLRRTSETDAAARAQLEGRIRELQARSTDLEERIFKMREEMVMLATTPTPEPEAQRPPVSAHNEIPRLSEDNSF